MRSHWTRVDLFLSGGFPYKKKRDTDTHREDRQCHAKMEARTGAALIPGMPRTAVNHQELGEA